jgi:hypothetical protein
MGWDAVGNRYADLFFACSGNAPYAHPIVELKQPGVGDNDDVREPVQLKVAT